MKKKDQICAQILDLTNEIEMMVEQKITKGLKEKRKQLSSLKSKLKKIEQSIAIHTINNRSPHNW